MRFVLDSTDTIMLCGLKPGDATYYTRQTYIVYEGAWYDPPCNPIPIPFHSCDRRSLSSARMFKSSMTRSDNTTPRANKAIDAHNRDVRAHNARVQASRTARKQAIDAYNRDVRAHNARVRANRTHLQSALQRFDQQINPSPLYRALQVSIHALPLRTRGWTLLVPTPSFRILPNRKLPTA